MPQILEPSNIRDIVDGEPHAAEVYNRPTHDLLEETDAKLVRTINELEATAIAMAIALG